MRRMLVILLLIPASIALKCWAGDGSADYESVSCPTGTEFCFRNDIKLNGRVLALKTCGGSCEKEGCREVMENVRECCCKGNLCNNAASSGSSMFMTILVAAGVAVSSMN
ncbi:hypothetical protein PMAYCL1PPCAC_11194 [Pristionchus mayeri]|uniref:Uncharacterized protein n=1 Tax=Pristionchus mayeri TaxID=1317129 RepID=A0AAN5CFB9_9BILA|nr:hypothetical protein PMAYCL1PPCAC_11194 [Pristionchus mayeri]